MDMLEAARKTLALAEERGLSRCSEMRCPETGFAHLTEMLRTMEAGEFSEGKMGRWLGWMQACVVAASNGTLTLEDMKQVNRSCS